MPARDVDLNTQFTPFEVEAEALSLLLHHGPAPAVQWAQAFLGRARWTDLMPYEWWPLHAFLAMVAVREGRTEEVEQWLSHGYVPGEYELVVRAAVELVQGRPESAAWRASRLIETTAALARWRLLAVGVRAAAASRTGETDDVLVSAHEWAGALTTLALLPSQCRELLGQELDPAVCDLPGLVVAPAADEAQPGSSVRLTRRQTVVLQRLDGGGTLAEIATELGLGAETVRSTAKALYKRLDVHDRDSAVRRARAVGLLD